MAAGPVGVLGIVVPLLLGALGIAMLRVRRLGTVHARISVGTLGALAGVTGIIQVTSGNPALSLSLGIAPLEEAGGMLGWAVGYPLAVLFSSVAAVILFILLIAFSALVISGRTIAELRRAAGGASRYRRPAGRCVHRRREPGHPRPGGGAPCRRQARAGG